MNDKILTKYIRDNKNQVIGAVVAVDKNKVGWCLVHPKDRNTFYSKRDVKQMALERAFCGFDTEIPKSLLYEYYQMLNRSVKYFTNDVNRSGYSKLDNLLKVAEMFCEAFETASEISGPEDAYILGMFSGVYVDALRVINGEE